MGDVAVQPLPHSSHGNASSSMLAQTITVVVVDEKGVKANCKLYRTERLAEILKKYNSRLHTTYDSIMIDNAPISLAQTPALLGLEDGQVLQFCKTSPAPGLTTSALLGPVASSSAPVPTLARSLTATSTTTSSMVGPVKGEADRVAKLEQRLSTLETDLTTANNRNELLQSKLVSLENKLTEEQEKTQCRICFDKYRDTLIFPCLHFSYCYHCLEELTKRGRECPTCRGHISGTLLMKIG